MIIIHIIIHLLKLASIYDNDLTTEYVNLTYIAILRNMIYDYMT